MVMNNQEKLHSNLAQLQNLIKRDPVSYKEEFERQYDMYKATKSIFELTPMNYNASLSDLLMFLAQISHCYTDELSSFPEDLVSILERHGTVIHPEMRLSLVKALVLLRNKNLLSPTSLLTLFFKLLRSQDKNLRNFLQQHIVSDIKNINSKGKNEKLNKELQNFMYRMLEDNHAVAVKMSLDILIELYKKQIWNDAKTVNIIASACFSKIIKVVVAAVKFFIGFDRKNEEDSDSDSEDDDVPSLKKANLALRVNKSKKKNKKLVEKAKAAQLKQKKKKNKKVVFDFSAIHLIHDPQNLAEKLYKKLEKMNERFEVKLMIMNFVSRLIGIHELYLPNFYPFLQRYLFVQQRDVTQIMMFAAQSAHSLVPSDELAPVLRTLSDNFVTERYSSDVMAMGLNAIREVCNRNPHSMNEDLLQDLAQYKTHKDKSVSIAARGLIGLFREKNSSLLARKDRGAPTELKAENKIQEFAALNAKEFIPGAEILSYNLEKEEKNRRMSDSESEDNEWMDVSDDENNSDSEEENEETNPRKSSDDVPVLSQKDAIKEIMKLTPEERAEKSKEIVMSRLLTDEDFKNIEAAQAAKSVERFSAGRKKAKKRKQIEEETQSGEIVSLESIEMIHKKRRHDKEARMQTVNEGRVGREKFGSRKQKMNEFASKSNKEKRKTKNFMMVKHKLKSNRQRTSFRDRQMKLKKSLLKQQKN